MDLSDRIGSLGVGKYADLIVLDKNLFEIEPHTIDEVEVLYTIMDGRLVYEAGKDR